MRPLARPVAPLLAAGLALLLARAPAAPARAEDEPGTTCGLTAFMDEGDAGLQAVYDGLRKGLELAQLPRVCLAAPAKASGGATGLVERLAAQAAVDRAAGEPSGPLFAIGDASCAALEAAGTRLPRVLAVERYSRGRTPLGALPAGPGAAVVYADRSVEDVGTLLRSLTRQARPRVAWAWTAQPAPAAAQAVARAFEEGAGVQAVPADAGEAPALLLHLRLGAGEPLLAFDAALRLAESLQVPMVSDERGRFGQGAVLTVVGHHDLVGRHAADAGRRLRADPTARLLPRPIPGVEVWIDLRSADAQGVAVPLALVARADRLRRGLPLAPGMPR